MTSASNFLENTFGLKSTRSRRNEHKVTFNVLQGNFIVIIGIKFKKKLKAVISSFNTDLQNTLLWLLFQDFMIISRGSLAHGGMYSCMCVGDIVQFNF